MRKLLKEGRIIKLESTSDSSRTRTFKIQCELGKGASCAAYRAIDTAECLIVVIKECFPFQSCTRHSNGSVIWRSPEKKTQAEERFREAFKLQREIQNSFVTMETCVQLVDGLYSSSETDTLYTLNDIHNAEAYSKIPVSSLQETFKTARAIAWAIGQYHKLGFLHLDIKPDNVLVRSDRHDVIWLMDYNSVIRKTDASHSAIPISYTEEYAAPEVLAHKWKDVCEATDIYSIGAVLFERIMGHVPTDADYSPFAKWDFADNPLFENLSEKVKRLSKELFRATLSAYIPKRCQCANDLIKMLDELIKESDPEKRYLNSTYAPSPNDGNFVGRNTCLKDAHAAFSSGARAVFLYGMSGIGKTELAMRYAEQYKDYYDVRAVGRFHDSLDNLFRTPDFISVENDVEGTTTLEAVSGLLNDERVLLIIDNFNAEDDPKLHNVLELKCRLLFTGCTSREETYRPGPAYKHIEVIELSPEDQKTLFEKECDHTLTKDECRVVDDILSTIEGYTLLIPLIAKSYKRGTYSLDEIHCRIKDAGVKSASSVKVRHYKDKALSASLYAILCEVLDMAKFTEEEAHVVRNLALLGDIVIDRSELLTWLGNQYVDVINTLTDKSWVRCQGDGPMAKLSLHSIIGDVACKELGASLFTCPEILQVIADKTKAFSENQKGLSVMNDVKITLSREYEYRFRSIINLMKEVFRNSDQTMEFPKDDWVCAVENMMDPLTGDTPEFMDFLLDYTRAANDEDQSRNRFYEAYLALMTCALSKESGAIVPPSLSFAVAAKEQADRRAATQGLTDEQLSKLYLRICMPLYQRICVHQSEDETLDFWNQIEGYDIICLYITELFQDAWNKNTGGDGESRNELAQLQNKFLKMTSPKNIAEIKSTIANRKKFDELEAELSSDARYIYLLEECGCVPTFWFLKSRLYGNDHDVTEDDINDLSKVLEEQDKECRYPVKLNVYDYNFLTQVEDVTFELQRIVGPEAWRLRTGHGIENEVEHIKKNIRNGVQSVYAQDKYGNAHIISDSYGFHEDLYMTSHISEMEGLFSCCYAVINDTIKCREHLENLITYTNPAPIRHTASELMLCSYVDTLIMYLLPADMGFWLYEKLISKYEKLYLNIDAKAFLHEHDYHFDPRFEFYEMAVELAQQAGKKDKTALYKEKIASLTGVRFDIEQ